MAGKRSKPLLIAPLIPLWGALGFFAIESLQRSRFLIAFVVLWTCLLVALFAFVASRAIAAKRARANR